MTDNFIWGGKEFLTPPSRKGHCCDCYGCNSSESGVCPFWLKKFCFICKQKSTIAYLMNTPEKINSANQSGCGAFWVCDEHEHDPETETMLKKGIDKKYLDMKEHGYVVLFMPEYYEERRKSFGGGGIER